MRVQLEQYKIVLTNLGKGLSKCTHIKNSLIRFFAASEKKFRQFETHFGQLQDNLNRIPQVEDTEWKWFRTRVLNAIRKCVGDLKAIKDASEGIVRLSREDEKAITWEEEVAAEGEKFVGRGLKNIVGNMKGQDKLRLEAMRAMLIELLGEVKDLSEIATHQVVKAIDPEIAAFGQLEKEVEVFGEEHKAPAFEGVRKRVAERGGKEVQEIVTVFKYIALGAEKIGRDEAIELREIKTINELTIDVDALMNKIARELGRVAESMARDARLSEAS
ncbi:hypothetical protein KY360_06665 [Candidatus Woesearchaeota archaeon]|nr:hypothetical protein [Candidatus Woesearchaeota archaeon]